MKAIIFDMDGVLIDSEKFYFNRRMKFFDFQNVEPGSRDIEQFIGKTEKQIWEILVPNDMNKREMFYKKFVEYRKKNPICFKTALRPSVKKTISTLYDSGIVLAIASSSPQEEINKMLKDCDLLKYFSYVISGHNLLKSKPDPEIYNKCKKALKCDRYFAVEDSEVGIESATSAGIYTIALKQEFNINQSKADIVINDLKEVVNIISSKNKSND